MYQPSPKVIIWHMNDMTSSDVRVQGHTTRLKIVTLPNCPVG